MCPAGEGKVVLLGCAVIGAGGGDLSFPEQPDGSARHALSAAANWEYCVYQVRLNGRREGLTGAVATPAGTDLV